MSSIVDGNIELHQKVWYQTENRYISRNSPQNSNPTLSFESPPPIKPNPDKNRIKLLGNHNIKIDYTNDTIKKSKDDTIIISCIEEIKCTGKFYTLSRQPLMRAYKNEDFLLRVNAEIKSNIDIIDTYFVKDYNITEKSYSGQKKIVGNNYKSGDQVEEIRLLCPISSSTEWLTKEKFNNSKTTLTFRKHRQNKSNHSDKFITPVLTPSGQTDNDDGQYNKNLLSKLPTNSTIIGPSSLSNSQMFSLNIVAPNEQGNKPDDLLLSTSNSLTMSTSLTGLNQTIDNKMFNDCNVKSIYHQTTDAVNLIEENRGFFKKIFPHDSGTVPIFGVYCIRWRRSGFSEENESKFVISGVEVIEPPINMYCYFDRKMYLRTPMTLKVTLKNPSSRILHLITSLNNCESFMFAGHKQVIFVSFKYVLNMKLIKINYFRSIFHCIHIPNFHSYSHFIH